MKNIFFTLLVFTILISGCTKDSGKVKLTYNKGVAVYGDIDEIRSTPLKGETKEIENEKYTDNILKNAPHNLKQICDWKYDYSIEQAFYPLEYLKDNKFYPSVGRVDDIYGDKELLSCCR